jgi:hypothetical protein
MSQSKRTQRRASSDVCSCLRPPAKDIPQLTARASAILLHGLIVSLIVCRMNYRTAIGASSGRVALERAYNELQTPCDVLPTALLFCHTSRALARFTHPPTLSSGSGNRARIVGMRTRMRAAQGMPLDHEHFRAPGNARAAAQRGRYPDEKGYAERASEPRAAACFDFPSIRTLHTNLDEALNAGSNHEAEVAEFPERLARVSGTHTCHVRLDCRYRNRDAAKAPSPNYEAGRVNGDRTRYVNPLLLASVI